VPPSRGRAYNITPPPQTASESLKTVDEVPGTFEGMLGHARTCENMLGHAC
jgi:hypothetical protein